MPGGAGTLVGAFVAIAIVAFAFAAKGGSQLERTTWTEVAFLLGGATLCALALFLPRPERTPAAFRGGWALAAFAVLAAFTALSITLVADAVGLVAGDEPDVRVPGRVRRRHRARPAAAAATGARCSSAWRSAAVVLCGWSLLTKVFPAAFATEERSPACDRRSSTGTASGWPPRWASRRCCGSAARRSGHARGQRARLAGARRCCASACCSPTRAARCWPSGIGMALWLAIVPLRLRALVDARRRPGRDGADRRLGVRAGRADRGQRDDGACASTPARASAPCCCCCSSR